MANLLGYTQWLNNLQSQPAFISNYWCAALAFDMEENKNSDGFKIPYYIVEEELMREDKNLFLTDRDDAYASPALRHWLIHLLKQHNEKTDTTNFETVLRDFLMMAKVLPPKMTHPLSRNTFFHNLPSECKLWIFYVLRTFKFSSPRIMRKVTTDLLGNEYFVVPGCRLYASIKDGQNDSLPINDSMMKDQSWESLYRFLYNQRFVQLCENQIGWDLVNNALQTFKLTDLYYSIRPHMMVEFNKNALALLTRDKERINFEDGLARLGRIPSAAEWEKNNVKQPKIKKNATEAAEKNVEQLQSGVGKMQVGAQQTPPNVNLQSPNVAKEWVGKCWNFPQCPLQDHCKYIHPRIRCNKLPNCPRGWNCVFLHDPCPNDGKCGDINCPNEHWKSLPTYHRKVREPGAADPRPVASVPPTVRKVEKKTSTDNSVPAPPAPAQGKTVAQQDNRKCCLYFPKCKKEHTDQYFHPTEPCKKRAAGKKCAGQNCLFLHGYCPQDGACEDMKCIYEHRKSPLIIERKLAKQKNQKPQGLSHAGSISNLSTCTEGSSGRRKSVSFDDEDLKNIAAKKTSTAHNPSGILRPAVNAQNVCRFRTRCKHDDCEYAHPRDKCPAYPKCPKGGACIFLHEVCKQDGVCTKVACDAEHHLNRSIDNNWCHNGSGCKRDGCKFLHPQECTGKCPTPDNCWKYHKSGKSVQAAKEKRPPPVPARTTSAAPKTLKQQKAAAAAAAAAAPAAARTPAPRQTAPSGPPGPAPPGYYPAAFPFPQYPSGTYPPFPPGPGGFGPYPGYGPYPPPGPYGYPPGPPGPPRPADRSPAAAPAPSPPPPYPARELSAQDLEFFERKTAP